MSIVRETDGEAEPMELKRRQTIVRLSSFSLFFVLNVLNEFAKRPSPSLSLSLSLSL
jgi:hypothetical protein